MITTSLANRMGKNMKPHPFSLWLFYFTNVESVVEAQHQKYDSFCKLAARKNALFQLSRNPVKVIGRMSLRNGMWYGLRNDITMRNVKYGKWRKKI